MALCDGDRITAEDLPELPPQEINEENAMETLTETFI